MMMFWMAIHPVGHWIGYSVLQSCSTVEPVLFPLYLNAYHAHDDNDAYFYLLFTLSLTVAMMSP